MMPPDPTPAIEHVLDRAQAGDSPARVLADAGCARMSSPTWAQAAYLVGERFREIAQAKSPAGTGLSKVP